MVTQGDAQKAQQTYPRSIGPLEHLRQTWNNEFFFNNKKRQKEPGEKFPLFLPPS